MIRSLILMASVVNFNGSTVRIFTTSHTPYCITSYITVDGKQVLVTETPTSIDSEIKVADRKLCVICKEMHESSQVIKTGLWGDVCSTCIKLIL